MRILTLLICLVSVFTLKAQTKLEEAIVGTWSVVKIQNGMPGLTKPEEAKRVSEMLKAFSQAKFYFNADRTSRIEVPIPEFAEMSKGYWRTNETTGRIIIDEKKAGQKPNSVTMEIQVHAEPGTVIFIMEDVPLAFYVKKDD